jgi:hypothetical protein
LNKQFSAFLNRNFLKSQFPNGSFSAIWFKIALFLYEIAIPNAPLFGPYQLFFFAIGPAHNNSWLRPCKQDLNFLFLFL